jgi:hypothetical protein
MTATTVFLCRMTLSLVSIMIATQSQIRASGSDGISAPSGSQEPGKLAMPRKADPNATVSTPPSAGKPKQIPVAPDRTQTVEERLRSGQMEKAIAQGEISDRLNQLYSGSNRVTGETAAEHSTR